MQWNVNNYARHAGYVPEFGKALIAQFPIRASDRVLDLGCGDGVLTKIIADMGCSVRGIDSSKEMVDAAKSRGVNATVTDAQYMTFVDEFDVVFSNAAMHWMKQAERVIKNVNRALRQSGRFCAEFGAAGNVKTIVAGIYEELNNLGLKGDSYNPWYFPSAEEYRQKLIDGGFRVISLRVFDRPTPLPSGVEGWLRTFAAPFLQDIETPAHQPFIHAVCNRLAKQLKTDHGAWFADYVRCRFVAEKAA